MSHVFAASQSIMNNENQEMAQSLTKYRPRAPRGRATEHQQLYMTARTRLKLSSQLSLFIPKRDDCNTRTDTKYCVAKQGPNPEPPQIMGATINTEKPTKELPY